MGITLHPLAHFPEHLAPVLLRADMLKSASANQPEVSVVGQGLKSSWGLVQGLKSCKCHGRRAGGSPAGTITTTRGSGRNTRAFECKPMSHSLSLTHGERRALFGNLPGQCCLWGGDLKWREGGLRACFPWWGKLGGTTWAAWLSQRT